MSGPLTLPEAKQQLNMTSSSSDAEVTRWLAAAQEKIEGMVGPLVPTPFTETHRAPGRDSLMLRQTPVVSVDLISNGFDDSQLWVANDLTFDEKSGRVWLRWGGCLVPHWGHQNGVVVDYVAGWEEVPESIREATGIILDHMWKTQRGWSPKPDMRGRVPGDVENAPAYPMGFLMPNRAAELLEQFQKVVVA